MSSHAGSGIRIRSGSTTTTSTVPRPTTGPSTSRRCWRCGQPARLPPRAGLRAARRRAARRLGAPGGPRTRRHLGCRCGRVCGRRSAAHDGAPHASRAPVRRRRVSAAGTGGILVARAVYKRRPHLDDAHVVAGAWARTTPGTGRQIPLPKSTDAAYSTVTDTPYVPRSPVHMAGRGGGELPLPEARPRRPAGGRPRRRAVAVVEHVRNRHEAHGDIPAEHGARDALFGCRRQQVRRHAHDAEARGLTGEGRRRGTERREVGERDVGDGVGDDGEAVAAVRGPQSRGWRGRWAGACSLPRCSLSNGSDHACAVSFPLTRSTCVRCSTRMSRQTASAVQSPAVAHDACRA